MAPVISKAASPSPRKRLDEIDIMKCIFILLMVIFHLVYIGDSYPYAKKVVYTFHMTGFLLFSGYLMNIHKSWGGFAKTLFWYALPYFIMESGYILMASLLPIREHIDQLTPTVFLDKLLLHPLGPYWYLQTLILCGLTYFTIFRIPNLSIHSRFIFMGLVFYVYAQWLHIISLSSGLYFLVGAILQQSHTPFNKFFQPSPIALLAFTLLILIPENLSPIQTGGIFIVYSVICIGMLLTRHLKGKVRTMMLFIGRNTLPIFLFSPIFTLLSKHLLFLNTFDSSGTLFTLTALPLCILGSFAIGWVMDIIHLSPLFFGKKKVLV